MNRPELVAGLANLSNKLRHMWGQNPESDLLDAAVKELEAPINLNGPDTAEVKPTTQTTTRAKKGH